jgi:hypothetical protein
MTAEYSIEACRDLEKTFRELHVYRPAAVTRYDQGAQLRYPVEPVGPGPRDVRVDVDAVVEGFVGGGFAGQVYKVRVVRVGGDGVPGLHEGGEYAVKILIPPSAFSALFRNLLHMAGFQGPFQLQCNPGAAMSGALWQKFIRRAAKIRFGDERLVNDVHATFVDEAMGSCGEITDWIDGRTWQLEVDDRMDLLARWRRGGPVDETLLGSKEYRQKKTFMAAFVALLHEMGAHEFARQYEWWTCKSQPNCLKRTAGGGGGAYGGLVAVDFRAGLVLLPFLPMSPGDVVLILKGIARGSLVQFDRGDTAALGRFVARHGGQFADMAGMLDRLTAAEQSYRDSLPDITHHHVRLLYSRRLWGTMLDNAVAGWSVRNMVDAPRAALLKSNRAATILFALAGLVPFAGRFVRRVWGRADWRLHYGKMVTSWKYLVRAVRARSALCAIGWHREGRIGEKNAIRLPRSLGTFWFHALFSVLPVPLHKFFTRWTYVRERLDYILFRPVRLYFNSNEREKWLVDMVKNGQRKRILGDDDAGTIVSQIKEPFIQKYLKSLAVHVCTLPVTQLVSVTLALIYVATHPDMPRTQAWAIGVGIIALFQVIPVSPGSLTRGLYVVYLVVRERNFRDYNIAVFLGFFKYIGYLSFPIQMTYRYPALARFMAVHWATEAVHAVPVFGEQGALLEHFVFRLFYNWPLTVRRRMRVRADLRSRASPRYWHVGVCALAAAAVLWGVEALHGSETGAMPSLKDIAWLAALLPIVCGAAISLLCGGAVLKRRIFAASLGGVMLGVLSMALSVYAIGIENAETVYVVSGLVWRIFLFGVFSSAGAVMAELGLPEPVVPPEPRKNGN